MLSQRQSQGAKVPAHSQAGSGASKPEWWPKERGQASDFRGQRTRVHALGPDVATFQTDGVGEWDCPAASRFRDEIEPERRGQTDN